MVVSGDASSDFQVQDAAEPSEDAVPLPQPPDAQASAERARAEQLLVGTYALRVRVFSREMSVGTATTEERIELATLAREPATGKLEMVSKLCRSVTQIQPPLTQSARSQLVSPQSVPERRFKVVIEGSRFRTVGEPAYWGYEPVAAGCVAGQSMQAPSMRPWLPGNECSCPLSDALPTSARDCRVLDSDGDGRPGLTAQVTGLVERVDAVCLKVRSQLVDGVVALDGHHSAQFHHDEDYFELTCEGRACTNSALVACAPELNPVAFAPLKPRTDGSAPSCAEVLQQFEAGELFPQAVGPSGC